MRQECKITLGWELALVIIILSVTNLNSMVLTRNQTHGPMEQNKELINKFRHLWSINLCQRKQAYTREKAVSSITYSGETGQLYVKEKK